MYEYLFPSNITFLDSQGCHRKKATLGEEENFIEAKIRAAAVPSSPAKQHHLEFFFITTINLHFYRLYKLVCFGKTESHILTLFGIGADTLRPIMIKAIFYSKFDTHEGEGDIV